MKTITASAIGLLFFPLLAAGSLPQIQCEEQLILRTERLELKPVPPSLVDQLIPIFTDVKTIKMSGDQVDQKTLEDILQMMPTYFGDLSMGPHLAFNFGIYVDGEVVGLALLWSGIQEESIYSSGIGRSPERWFSLSFVLKSSFWNRGIATEAVRRLIHFTFEKLNANGIHAQSLTSNTSCITKF